MRHSTFLEVNLGLLQENIQSIKSLTSKTILAMVKANAYGNGIAEISNSLRDNCGISQLGVASLGEAIFLKNNLNNTDTAIYVFSDTEIKNNKYNSVYESSNIVPVLGNKEDLAFALKHLPKTKISLKINTGMNRLGLMKEELEPFLPMLKSRGVKHLASHFSSSYFPIEKGDANFKQLEEFNSTKSMLIDSGVAIEESSLACSGAIEQKFGLEETHIRPGLMMYGPYSVSENSWKGHQISKFQTKVLKKFILKKGQPIGYGGTEAHEDCLILILPIGYADLCVTTAVGASISINGHQGTIYARVNMDMMFIKMPVELSDKFKEDDAIEFWSHDNKVISNLAKEMKTIPYHLMCGVSSRIPRIYRS